MAPPEHSPSDITVDDTHLALRIRAGEVEAFRTLFLAHHAALCAFAERFTGDDARAQELVQDLFLELWQKRETLAFSGSVRAYLFAAVRNRALNVRRRDAVEREWEDDEALDDVRALHQAPVESHVPVEAEEQARRLNAAFATLPERCRTVMELRWQEGLTYAEVAQALGIGVKAVEKQLARGLRLLRDALGA